LYTGWPHAHVKFRFEIPNDC